MEATKQTVALKRRIRDLEADNHWLTLRYHDYLTLKRFLATPESAGARPPAMAYMKPAKLKLEGTVIDTPLTPAKRRAKSKQT